MRTLVGNTLHKGLLERLEPVATLIDYDGPLLYLSQHDDGAFYLLNWVDTGGACNRWLAVPVSRDLIRRFIDGQETLLNIVLQKPAIYLIDTDAHGHEVCAWCIAQADIPEEYLATDDSYLANGTLPDKERQKIDAALNDYCATW